jgi:hypothetical protein
VINVLGLGNVTGSGRFDSGLAAEWYDGDFNHDGVADSLDVADFLATDLFGAGSYTAPGGSVVAVLEPTVATLVGVAAGMTAVALTRRTPEVCRMKLRSAVPIVCVLVVASGQCHPAGRDHFQRLHPDLSLRHVVPVQ